MSEKLQRSRLFASISQWIALAIALVLGFALFAFVDLAPEVQADFFFSSNDPQLQSSLKIEKEFGQSQQIIIAARSKSLVSTQYLQRLYRLTVDLQKIKGVADVKSLTHGPEEPDEILEDEPDEVYEDLVESPFWSRLLLAPDRSATFVVVRLANKGQNSGATIHNIDRVLRTHSKPGFQLGTTGVPYVSEHLRDRLTSELRFFSIAAFIAFAILVTLLFRSAAILVGTMAAALTASFATFLIRAAVGMKTDILAPNLWTIAFVLTLSHVVYLTAEWQREARKVGSANAAGKSMRAMIAASSWSLVANLLGFASLIFVSAEPLRQFGISGSIAAVMAMVCAYGLYPPFLRAAKVRTGRPGAIGRHLENFFTSRHRVLAVCTLAIALVLAPFAWQANTDPTLPSYFSSRDPIRTGLETVDRSGGSSTLDIVVADARGGSLDNKEIFERLSALQRRIERHSDVGAVLSIGLLMEEANRPWYSFLFSSKTKLKRLEDPKHDSVGRTFISEDRQHARLMMRMHETKRSGSRTAVVNEIKQIIRQAGFKPVLVGGLYPLQGELAKLVEGSVVRGLGGLLVCFFVIVLIVTRSLPHALAMTLCLSITPFVLFGIVTLLGVPLDVISAPAANVALPLGIDEMIHLGYTVRQLRKDGKRGDAWKAWQEALAKLWRPILASMLIVTSGFALFLLSNFPPTQRLGLLVCIGAAITDIVVLVILPAIVNLRSRTAKKERRRAEPKAA